MSTEPSDWRQLGAVSRERAAEILDVSVADVDLLAQQRTLYRIEISPSLVRIAVHSIASHMGQPLAPTWQSPPIKRPALCAQLRRQSRGFKRGICGIYVIRCEATGRYKIGKAMDVRSRLFDHSKRLIGDRMPGPLSCLRVIQCSPRMLAWIEHALHLIYGESRQTREEIFEGGVAPPPESLRTAADVLALYREKVEALLLEEASG